MVELADEQFESAKQRGEMRLQGPRDVAARYDAGRGRIVIALSTGIELGLTPRHVEGLVGASVDELRAIEIESQGLGIHFPKLDADLYVPALLEGVLGHGAGWRHDWALPAARRGAMPKWRPRVKTAERAVAHARLPREHRASHRSLSTRRLVD